VGRQGLALACACALRSPPADSPQPLEAHRCFPPPPPPPPTPQGLFHPARKVRQKYWKVYNNLYIGAQDALVSFLPRIPDPEDGSNTFARHELDLMI
jgi:hypothetical protein